MLKSSRPILDLKEIITLSQAAGYALLVKGPLHLNQKFVDMVYCREPPHMGLRDYGGERTYKRRAR